MSQSAELKGTLSFVGEIQSFGDNGFTKREIRVNDGAEKYDQDVQFTLIKDKTSLVEGMSIGTPVKVTYNIRSNEHNGRYYTDLQAWKLEAKPGSQPVEEDADPEW